ncbi:phosphotransferase family protein [Nonomuraea rubra]|uniref:phosphotransferase family protein n=1 Tax=Nonomuraea rubra TaxID=46180 RepID=UPI00340C3359
MTGSAAAGSGAGRRFAGPEELAALTREVYGAGRRLARVERLTGGSKKGVYRLSFQDQGPTAVLYVWSGDEDYWDPADRPEPFAHGTGLGLFKAAHARLSAAGVRVPDLYFADDGHELYPADVALIEDVRGGTLEARLAGEHAEPMARLADGLRAMARCRSRDLGKVALVESGQGISEPASRIVLEVALGDLAEAASRVEPIGRAAAELEERLRELAAGIEPRTDHGLIHGELGPDHVLMDDDGRPVLIDIEGAMFFDVEWEHVFLRIRFGDHYARLRADGLDERRMRFYRLAQHLSLVAGPLRLLDGDFPDRAFMLEIARHHTQEVLQTGGMPDVW